MCVPQLKWLFNFAALSCHWQNCENKIFYTYATHSGAFSGERAHICCRWCGIHTWGIHIQPQQADAVIVRRAFYNLMMEEKREKTFRLSAYVLIWNANIKYHFWWGQKKKKYGVSSVFSSLLRKIRDRELSPKESQLRFKITQQSRMNDSFASTVRVQKRQNAYAGMMIDRRMTSTHLHFAPKWLAEAGPIYSIDMVNWYKFVRVMMHFIHSMLEEADNIYDNAN